jgi:peptidoglycan hydrolase-like protein with peptidoglycan-binding domain
MCARLVSIALLALALIPASAMGAPRANVAALQAALRARGLYTGTIDGLRGPATARAVRRLQRRAGIAVDGIPGRHTRRALGRLGRHAFGSRPLRPGLVGWDVAGLQFKLETHGFPCGGVDGGYGAHVTAAVRRLQAFHGLAVDGVAGPATLRALRAPPPRSPLALRRPVAAPVGDRYGPRGAGFHAGLDFLASRGTPVVAAGAGRVRRAGWLDGYGRVVVVGHAAGTATLYAHLSSIAASPGEAVSAGALLGRVGASGRATGPHLHFEVIVRGANVDPGPALGI